MSVTAASLETLRKIVNDKQAARLRWPDETGRGLLVDLFTASRVVSVYDALTVDNQAKVERMIAASRVQFLKVVNVCMSAK